MSDKDNSAEVIEENVSEEEEGFQFVEAPSFDVNYKGECAYEVKTVIAASNAQKRSEELFEELQAEAVVDGFRKGKAPRALLERKFSKAVRGDVVQSLVGAAFEELIKQEDLKPIAMPDIDGLEEVLEADEKEPMEMVFKFEVAARCELGTYRGIEVEKLVAKIDKKNVNEALDGMRERFAVYESKKNIKAKEGDQVIIDFVGKIDDEAFQGGSADNYPYILGSGRFFSEFEEVLKGAKKGAELSCDVTFPEDYHGKDVAGKTASFTITVNDVKRKVLPELDDEFAKQAGAESLDELREQVETQMKEGASQQGNAAAERKAMDAIIADTTFELPKSVVQSSADEYYRQEVNRLMAQHVPAEEIEKNDEEIRKGAQEAADRGIKAYVVLNEIGVAEGIEVTDEDFEKEAEAIQMRTGMEMDVVNRFLAQDDKRDDYADRIFREKAMAVVMDNAKITEKEVTQEELDAETEEDTDE